MNAGLDLRARRAASALHLSAEGVDPLASLNQLHRVKRQRARAQVAVALVVLVTLVATGVLLGRGDTPVVGPLPSLATIPVGPDGHLYVSEHGYGGDPTTGRILRITVS